MYIPIGVSGMVDAASGSRFAKVAMNNTPGGVTDTPCGITDSP